MSGGGYYDLDAVLLGQEHVPCTLTQGVIKLGHLDVSQQGAEHLVEGTRLELPYWAVEQWEDKQPGFLKVETPKAFNAAHQETLKADATVVNLFAWSPYYYLFGLAYARMADDALLVDTLQAVFSERYPMIMDMSQNAVKDDTSEKTRLLDNLERNLFQTGLQCDVEQQRWMRRQHHRIVAAKGMEPPTHISKRRKAAQMR